MHEPLSEAEHQAALAETLPYEWIVTALSMASVEMTDDLTEILDRAMEESPPANPLARLRMTRLLEALHDERGVTAD
jgi:hypothetical protein